MMGCSAVGDTELYMQMNGLDTGIMSGHAYGIIDVFELKDDQCKNYHKSHRLLKVRNPWGHGEWKLKWSEHPDFIDLKLNKHIDDIRRYERDETDRCKKEQREPPEEYKIGVDDGTFLMSFKAWRKIFTNLFTCM